jgi:hypothetical protein
MRPPFFLLGRCRLPFLLFLLLLLLCAARGLGAQDGGGLGFCINGSHSEGATPCRCSVSFCHKCVSPGPTECLECNSSRVLLTGKCRLPMRCAKPDFEIFPYNSVPAVGRECRPARPRCTASPPDACVNWDSTACQCKACGKYLYLSVDGLRCTGEGKCAAPSFPWSPLAAGTGRRCVTPGWICEAGTPACRACPIADCVRCQFNSRSADGIVCLQFRGNASVGQPCSDAPDCMAGLSCGYTGIEAKQTCCSALVAKDSVLCRSPLGGACIGGDEGDAQCAATAGALCINGTCQIIETPSAVAGAACARQANCASPLTCAHYSRVQTDRRCCAVASTPASADEPAFCMQLPDGVTCAETWQCRAPSVCLMGQCASVDDGSRGLGSPCTASRQCSSGHSCAVMALPADAPRCCRTTGLYNITIRGQTVPTLLCTK